MSNQKIISLLFYSFFCLKKSFNDFDQAIDSVKQGHYWGVASIQYNFTQAVRNKFGIFLEQKFHLNLFI
jgi:hypothetical protein